jgi:hypothetical protein
VRLRSKRKTVGPSELSHQMIVEDDVVDSPPPVLWSVEQLNALGPVTGPSHRTFVPIVRSTLGEGSFRDPIESQGQQPLL